jgi:glucose/arabinose dehydrogenase
MAGSARIAAALLVLATVAGCGGGGAVAQPRAASSTPGATRSTAAAAARGVRLARIGRFDSPVYITSPPGDRRRQFVVERDGRVIVLRDGRRLSESFLDIRDQVTSGGEQGLLSIAFAPDYTDSGYFYAYYTDRSGDQRVVEFRRRDADHADAGSERLVLRMADSESNHNGGLLLFGPDDLLYIGTGDGGGAGDRHGARGNAQNLGSLLGKILRIDPRASGGRAYRVPDANPFSGRAGARAEVYAYGLRNPWRFSFDRANGDLAIGDVGQNAYEEVDFVRRGTGRGANFGWRPFEGRTRYTPGETAPGYVAPVIVRAHSAGNCSIIGGVVVRDPDLPALRGRYIFGDYCKGRIRSAILTPSRARSMRRTALAVTSLSSFGEDAQGRVYAVSLAGPVYRVVPRG